MKTEYAKMQGDNRAYTAVAGCSSYKNKIDWKPRNFYSVERMQNLDKSISNGLFSDHQYQQLNT